MRLSKQGERKRPAVVKEERRREAQERGGGGKGSRALRCEANIKRCEQSEQEG